MKNRRAGKWIAFGLIALIVTGYTVIPSEIRPDSPDGGTPVAVRTAEDSVVSIGDDVRREVLAKEAAAPDNAALEEQTALIRKNIPRESIPTSPDPRPGHCGGSFRIHQQ